MTRQSSDVPDRTSSFATRLFQRARILFSPGAEAISGDEYTDSVPSARPTASAARLAVSLAFPFLAISVTLSAMDYQVNLETFRGPLDLLLYLVKRNEVDICDIPIARVAEQFLEYM